MSDQLRPEKETAGQPQDSRLQMSKETEQRVIREFQSPFPDKEERRSESHLLKNACWDR
jgi:hypothetical protein